MATVRYTSINSEVVAEKRGGIRSFYGSDPLGSLVTLYDATGIATDTFTFWPYGEIRTSSGTTNTPFKFCGTIGYYTNTSERIYVRARWYRDKLARWQTMDALWPKER